MLTSLSVQDFALFSSADFSPGEGFCALTGQTGAGKSLVVDALSFVAGHRKGREVLRAGSERCEVRALFSPVNTRQRRALLELGVETGEDGIEFFRSLSADGRTVCRINGRQTTLTVLRLCAQLFVDIHEQDDAHQLLSGSSHISYLDAFYPGGELTEIQRAYQAAYENYLSLKNRFAALYSADRQEEKARREFLEYQIRELAEAQVRAGEYEELVQKKEALSGAREISRAAQLAREALSGEGGAYDRLMQAADALSSAARLVAEWQELSGRLEALGYEIEGAAAQIADPLPGEEDPALLIDRIDERLSALRRLFSLYAPTEEGLIDLLREKEAELCAIDHAKKEARRLHAQAKEARENAAQIALELREKRKIAAHRLEEQILCRLSELDMPAVRFEVRITPLEKLGPGGLDHVEFYIGTNVGQPMMPLSKVASGGELSRILLALRCVLSQIDSIDTLVFDEIDTGVSGKSASKIGRAMRSLSADRQVLAVTHSAQVAAFAHHQVKVEKEVEGEETVAHIRPLSREGRVGELARILGGETITEISLAGAKELLELSEK